jgi:hypothetical protein
MIRGRNAASGRSGTGTVGRGLLESEANVAVRALLKNNIDIATNFIDFLEYVRVIFEQKGFVGTGLSAAIVVAKKPFSLSSKPLPRADNEQTF